MAMYLVIISKNIVLHSLTCALAGGALLRVDEDILGLHHHTPGLRGTGVSQVTPRISSM